MGFRSLCCASSISLLITCVGCDGKVSGVGVPGANIGNSTAEETESKKDGQGRSEAPSSEE